MARPRRVRIVVRSAGEAEACATIFGYGATWTYKIDAHDHSAGFEDPAFDDSTWDVGEAAFGHVIDGEQTGGAHFPPCVVNRPLIQTAWTPLTDLCLRKEITIPATVTRLYIEFGIDNISTIYLDGVEVATTTNVGCQTRGTQSTWIDNPPTGQVMLAIRCRDPHPNEVAPYTFNDTFFDMKVDACGPTVTIGDADWSDETLIAWDNINANACHPTWFDGADGTVHSNLAGGAGKFWCHVDYQRVDQIRIKWNGGAQSNEFFIEYSDDVDPDYLPTELGGSEVPVVGSPPGSTWQTVIHARLGTGGGAGTGAPFAEYEDSLGVVHPDDWSDGYFTTDFTFETGGVTARLWRMRIPAGKGNSDVGTISAVGTGAVAEARGVTRTPGAVLAYIEDAKFIGGSKFHNSPGELFFTLQNTHPQIGVIKPWETHWALEEFRGEGWTELNSGWFTDYDTTEQETIFYGLDYLGILSLLHDERFNPEAAPDAVAFLYPEDETGTKGSKYVENTITEIVTDQIDRAIASGGANSQLSFFTRGAIAAMAETVTIFCTLKERLAFIGGLIDSHRAGTGKRTRLQAVTSRTWVNAFTWTPSYSFTVLDNPGQDRNDLRFEYGPPGSGGLVQGYRVIPFEEFATRILGIGKTSTGFRLEFHIEPTPVPEGYSDNYSEIRFGRLNRVNFWEDIIDLNDLRRRSRQLAGQVGATGKKVGIGIRVDAVGVEDGWDLCDSVPVVIERGPLDTTGMGGGGLWTIWGWSAIYQSNGYSEMVLTLLPKDVEQELPDGWDESSTIPTADAVQVHDEDPPDDVQPTGPTTWVNSETGHIWTVDPETGLWVDRTDAGDFTGLFALPAGGAVGDYLRHDGAGAEWQKNKLNATVAPTVNEDSGDGYSVGSIWIDVTADQWYVCVDATVAAAVWRQILPISLSGLASGDRLRYDGSAFVNTRRVWMPLTTVVAGVPELVWDADNSLIPTEIPE